MDAHGGSQHAVVEASSKKILEDLLSR
jgi:hypothetical protein